MTKTIYQDDYKQRFHSLIQDAPFSAALFTGDDLTVEMANAISLQIWGKDKSVIGLPLLEAIPEIKDQYVFEQLKNVYLTGQPYEGKEHTAWLNKSGVLTKIFVNIVYQPIRNDEGDVTGVFAVGHDVTDQVSSRKELEASETRARVAIESAGLGTFELHYASGKSKSSARFDEIFGFETGAPHAEYVKRIHPDDLTTRNIAHQQALTTGKLEYQARVILPTGITRWVRINGSIIFDEKHEPMHLIGTALDITEEVTSFQKLRESEEKFRTLISETPEIAVGLYVGREMRIQYVNDMMLQFWGKDASIIGKTWKEALPELDGQPFFEELDNVFATGRQFTSKETKATLKRNGKLEIGYFDYTFKALKNLNGDIYAIHHMAIDVTEQVKSKVALVEREGSVRRLFEQTPVGIAMFKGESFEVEMVNETLLSYWGRPRYEIINRSIWDAMPELVSQGIKAIAQNVYHTGESYTSGETPVSLLRHGLQETIIVRFGFQAIKDWQGNITGVLAIANEVTDLVVARKNVEKNEMRLNFLANSMPQVVWIADSDGQVKYYNDRVLEFAGAKQNDDGTWIWEGILHPDDLERTNTCWLTSVKNLTPYETEHRVLMRDGSYRWHLSRAYAYATHEGTKWYGTATDVHDKKVLEMGLEAIVKERTLELQRSNDDLQQFAHVASHDLKEPVRKIKTFSYKLQDEYKNVLTDRGNTFVNKIINAADRMNAMINGVLNYASMPSSSNKFELVDLNATISNVQNDLEILIHEKHGTITYHALPSIYGIVDLIHQLFYNLINNALKFSKKDIPALIHITAKKTVVNDQQFCEIILTDNGIGFNQEQAEQIFSTFVRLNSKDQYEGSGLGLALCKKIVERHGGMIRAVSEKDKGAQFHILLPSP
ncbi:PAS domain S-box protein [Pseudochryseolinea flava]|uniref:histidine kinase n=1 Tax=Pseudochryseolinea flava TaxID=2059302 RepID=A0A364XUZ9_9BACT|nr:PAS domain S-box protein [Pseudochryseolinea flava]RAV98134.1 PAS domain-containing sensor histidine kinase [Pseudochryseolinea flava]